MKKIIVCSNKKYQNEIIKVTELLSKDNLMFMPILLSNSDINKELYLSKIELIDTLVVINKDSFDDALNEIIKIAKEKNKEIIYYTDLINQF